MEDARRTRGRGRLLGLDFGSHRIGAAISDPLGIIAQPLPPIRRRGDNVDIEAIGALIREYSVEAVILGLPLMLDGNVGGQAKKANDFGDKIRQRLGVAVEAWDERLTTVQAERHLIASGIRREKRKELRDSLSAALLLQSALDCRNRRDRT